MYWWTHINIEYLNVALLNDTIDLPLFVYVILGLLKLWLNNNLILILKMREGKYISMLA